jgi:hypothetical protein
MTPQRRYNLNPFAGEDIGTGVVLLVLLVLLVTTTCR